MSRGDYYQGDLGCRCSLLLGLLQCRNRGPLFFFFFNVLTTFFFFWLVVRTEKVGKLQTENGTSLSLSLSFLYPTSSLSLFSPSLSLSPSLPLSYSISLISLSLLCSLSLYQIQIWPESLHCKSIEIHNDINNNPHPEKNKKVVKKKKASFGSTTLNLSADAGQWKKM